MASFKSVIRTRPITVILVGGMTLIYLIEVLMAKAMTIDTLTLYRLGAQFTPSVLAGEWWRVITAGFLHVSLMHLILNMLVLYYIGQVLEGELGHVQFLVLVLLTIVSGNMVGLVFGQQNAISAGVSGGLYGLFGAILMLGILDKRHQFWQAEARTIAVLVVISLISSFLTPQIDFSAHFGGLVGGFILVPTFLKGTHLLGTYQITWGQRLLSSGLFLLIIIVLGFITLYQ